MGSPHEGPPQPPNSLDERKLLIDAELRRRELDIKEAESKRGGLTTAQASVAGAVIALISGLAGGFISAWSSQSIESGKSLTSLQIEELKVKGDLELERSKQNAVEALERKKFETSLILQAIKTQSRSDAIRNLKFFVKAGFVADPEGKIAKLEDEDLPSISTPSPESAKRALQATGVVNAMINGRMWACTGVAISPQHVITTHLCAKDRNQIAFSNAMFRVGGLNFPLKLIASDPDSSLALLQIDSADRLNVFLDQSRIREPHVGESVYLALSLNGMEPKEIRTCKIVAVSDSIPEFTHNCKTGAGSAGAIVIAVADDALLGVHYAARDGAGVARNLARIIGSFAKYLSPADGETGEDSSTAPESGTETSQAQ